MILNCLNYKLIKKFIIYYTDISSSGAGRNKDELRIQLSIAIKLKLFGYTAENFNILLIGFNKDTNTFTFWKYDKDVNLNTKQSLYTRKKFYLTQKTMAMTVIIIKKEMPLIENKMKEA